MFLVRKLVLLCLRLNIVFKTRRISDMFSNKADALSRLQVDWFRQFVPNREIAPQQLLQVINTLLNASLAE